MTAEDGSLYEIEMEAEVRAWLESLSDRAYGQAEFYADRLSEKGSKLGPPYTDHLEGKVWELRPAILGIETRITYWITPDRRIVLLTVFTKKRSHEQKEIDRAVRAQEICEAEHDAHPADVYDREN